MSGINKLFTLVIALLNVLMVAEGLQQGITVSIATGLSMLVVLVVNWVTEGDSKLWSSLALWSYVATGACVIMHPPFVYL